MILSEKNNLVVKARNIGVSFETGRQRDDIKSILFSAIKDKGKSESKKKVWSLKDISFDGHQGEILGIIGSNGAGKTTLSKIIAGILKEDKGDINVNGKVTALFSFGMGFNQELTGRENVYLNGMMLGIEKEVINHYIDDIHEFSEIGEFLDQPMKYYSSGMRARLGFSVAAHLEPEVLILDEALNTGDARFSRKAAEKMKEIVNKAKLVIIVTHGLLYAQRNCDRLMWIDNGKVREIGDPKEIVQKYRATVPPRPPRKNKNLQLKKTETNIEDNIVIKAEKVGISYQLSSKEFWALKDVNFEVREGEVIGIIGHNGAGKSTLCKVLTNILVPDTGNIEINGKTSALLGYGTGFNPQLTGVDNIYLNAMLLGIPKKRVNRDFDKIVEFSGIGDAINKPVKNYSAGMKSRLGFSIAAILQPDVFIIDEALSTGDIAFQQKASERIQDMMERAKAVIIVSHSMGFIEKVCTRAIWMEKGQIRYDGTAEEAVAKYREANGVKRKIQLKQNNGIDNNG
ncbi:ATP-binding cassette domain-containing protein [Ornithinibacillus massiliensis]|uniref:ATP-binding cassette domain-containing protein n=1 Tax=Ornithinibacillus massiliensis TaxID=1944633 RepID=A0ABS5MB51_9BACI|nr:ATP-binding cassette domain-containing protein [Ornithinibacillus massiliensis]MBS3679303.1 ATP-binding cassette domain-containing protein [Ornithinibacillus massiliensis]